MSAAPSRAPVPARKGSLLRAIQAVAWGFFGVRKNSEYQEDIARLTPLHVIAVGLVAALLFVGLLVLVVRYVAAP